MFDLARGGDGARQRARLLIARLAGCGAAQLTVGAAVGGLVALTALDVQFIIGTGGAWARPEGDLNVYLIAWHYFVGDAWHLPLFEVPAMGYPEGSNIVFSDALPLAALATKAVHSLIGVAVVPFGWWILLTYVLQGAMAARLVRTCGVRSIWASIGAATLAVCNIPFMWRMGHPALSSHFVIIWALAIYFESARRGRLRPVETCLLLTVSLMINVYLFAMVAVLTGTTVLALWQHKQIRWSDIRTFGIGFPIVIAVGVVEGYGVLLRQPSAMVSDGLGVYSWNMVTVLVPPETVWGFPRGIVRDATGGQYEGESYVGLGALLLLGSAAVISRRTFVAHARRHAVLIATLGFLAVVAASNKVYVGGMLVGPYDLSRLVVSVASSFRGTGRFIWPLMYAMILLPVALVSRQLRPAVAVPLIVVAIALQVTEAAPTVQTLRLATSQSLPDLIDSPRLTNWLMAHERLWQYPSWHCGGLVGSKRVWLGAEANRELQVQLLGARVNRPTNSVVASRSFKDCARESAWAQQPSLEDGVLYLLGRDAVFASPALTALTTSAQCVDITWALACSKAWSRGTNVMTALE